MYENGFEMALIPTDKLESGMVLAADVNNRLGRLMLQAGTQIETKHIRILKAWGVTEVETEGEGKGDSEELDSAVLEQASDEVRDLFSHTDLEHPAVAELYRLKVKRVAERREAEAEDG